MPLVCGTRRWSMFLLALLVVVCGLGDGRPVMAQDPGGSTAADTTGAGSGATTAVEVDTTLAAPAADDGGEMAAETTRRHPRRLGVVVHGMRQLAVHIVRNEARNINDLTTNNWAVDGGMRWFAMDGLSLNLRYMRGGLGITDRPEDRALFADLRGDEFLQLDGYVFALNAYLGNRFFPRHRLNPYLVFCVSRIDWAFNRDGRDGEPYLIQETALEGTDMGLGAGLGLEYPLPVASGLTIELEWVWHYVMTEDDQRGTLDEIWTNSQFWNAGVGLAWHF